MKTIAILASAIVMALSISGCNTWAGVKQDVKQAGQAAGSGIEKAGEKVQGVSK